jgi:hypothetical protein
VTSIFKSEEKGAVSASYKPRNIKRSNAVAYYRLLSRYG